MEKFNPLVSVVIPVYNGENFVAEAIDSAIAQTYQNIEILVVDDGSKDRTKEIVKRYGDKVRYLYKDNGGVASALNYGINHAKGEYISWLSHDDIFHADKIEKQIKILSEVPKELRDNTFLYSAFEEMNEDLVIYDKFEPHKKYPIEKLQNPYFPAIFGLVNGCTTFIPVKALKDIGLFNEELHYTQDSDLWYRIFPKINVKYHRDITLISRKHRAQDTNRIDPKKIKEQNSLYMNMVNKLSVKDMEEMYGSEENFLRKVLEFVYELKYLGAAESIEIRLSKLKPKKESWITSFFGELIRFTPMYKKYKMLKMENEKLTKKVAYLTDRIKELDKNVPQ